MLFDGAYPKVLDWLLIMILVYMLLRFLAKTEAE